MSLILPLIAKMHRLPHDPYWSSVITLLHFNGVNNSTTIVEQVGTYTWGINSGGTGKLSTAQVKLGSASLLLDGTSCVNPTSGLSYSDGTFNLGTANFTWEGWIYPTTTASMDFLSRRATADNSNFWALRRNATSGTLRFFNKVAGTMTIDLTTVQVITGSVWTHIAVVRNSGVTTIYLNGTAATLTGTDASTAIANPTVSTSLLRIGMGDDSFLAGMVGYMDEWRITKGVARYTANFTPATVEFLNQ